MLGNSGESEDSEISLIDIFLFIKSSLQNISKSVVFTLLIGSGYYYYTPNLYEATVNIQMALVAGNAVESPTVLSEKVKLPLYFTQGTWNSCDFGEITDPRKLFAEKIKPTLNKSAPFIGLSVHAESPQKAKNCLTAVITDIQAKQAEIAEPILEQKKVQLQELHRKLKIAEETSKFFSPIRLPESFPDSQFASRALVFSTAISNAREIQDLRNAINDIEVSLFFPQTRPTYWVAPMYATEVDINKRPSLIFSICLMLGIFMGLAVTSIQRILPVLSKKIKDAQPINTQI